MEEEKTVDPIFKRGFEHGYWLQRGNKPVSDTDVNKITMENYKAGLFAGQREADREIFLANLEKQKTATSEHKPKRPKMK